MSIGELFHLFIDYPILFVGVILVGVVIFVNGYSDCANSIATAVSTKAIRPKLAIRLSAIFNVIGLVAMYFISKATFNSVRGIVSFGDDSMVALFALCATMVAVIFWGFFASHFGIPSSQSHSLIAGLIGAGLACMTLKIQDVSIVFGWNSPVMFTIYGILITIVGGFILGFVIAKLIELICIKMHKVKTKPFFKYGQIVGMCGNSLVHGAQDGLKFLGILALFFIIAGKAKGFSEDQVVNNPGMYILLAFTALILFIGTFSSGYKIIKKIGMGIFKLDDYQGFATDIGATLSIFFSTYVGIPLSTGQIKTFTIVGVGATKGLKHINWRIVGENLLSIVFSFPCCGLIGYVLTLIVVSIYYYGFMSH